MRGHAPALRLVGYESAAGGQHVARAGDALLGRLTDQHARAGPCVLARRELPRSEIARLTQIDYSREMAFIAVRARADGGEETLGVVRALCDPDNVEAEFAIVVRSDLHGHGLGHLLLARMLEYLAEHGTRRVVAYVLRENDAMRTLAMDGGFVVDARTSDSDTVSLVKTLRPEAGPPS